MIVSTKTTSATVSASVITTAELKQHLRVTHSDEDALIEAYRDAAVEFVESYCNTRLFTGQVQFNLKAFTHTVELPIGPVTNVASVAYKQSKTGASQYLNSADYYVEADRNPPVIVFTTLPGVDTDDPSPVTITCAVGYASTPEPLKQAVRFLVGHYYENRQAADVANVREVPMGVYSLINPYRNVSFL